MKKILPFLCATFVIVIVFLSSFDIVAFRDMDYYDYEFDKNNCEMTTGFDKDTLKREMEILINYMKTGNVEEIKKFENSSFFNEREKAHMKDVRGIVRSAIFIRRFCFIGLIILLCVGLFNNIKYEKYAKAFVVVFSTFWVLFLIIAASAAINFNKAFVIFHKIFFNNDLWLLDPAESKLINMVPESFFSDTFLRICIVFFVISGIIFVYNLFVVKRLKKVQRG